ncbi:MAG: UGSC family (seleno)protein [Burkholderiales bacterium]
MLRASAVAEQAGVPTASLCCEGFVGQAKSTSEGLGYPNLQVARVPGHVDVQSVDELRKNVLAVTVDDVVRCLTEAVEAVVPSQDPGAREIVFEGSFEDVNRLFLENRWSDGLPIVPPTPEKIARFLAFTDRDADEVLGKVLPDNREATIWNIAVNGVLAGCRPEYMPVLIAAVEAMVDPLYGVEHSGNTPGSETQIVVNGPIARDLGFNYEQGALRDGFQANTSIGRFWRLYLRNVAGFLPHYNDKGTFGGTWRVVLAENEAVLKRIGWSNVAADMGAPAGANAVTISRFTGANVIASVFGDTPEKCLPYLADALVTHTTWEVIFTVGMSTGMYCPMLVLSPVIAETIARAGWSKADVQRWLFDNARMKASRFENYLSGWTNLVPGRRSLLEMTRLGRAPRAYGGSADPDRLVPIVGKPEDFMIAVSGDALRSNCYVLVHNGILGYPVTKTIAVPQGWHDKLAQAA